MRNKIITKIKNLVAPIIDYFKILPIYGKVILIIVFLFVNFCLPNVIFMPILQQVIAKRMNKITSKETTIE